MADNWQLKAVLSANAQPMLKALGDVSAMAKNARKYLADVGSSAGKLGAGLGLPLTALSGVLGGLSIMAIKNAVVGFTDMGEAIQKGALKAGMSVEQYQRMRYVAEQSGTSIEAMEGSLSKLNRSVGDAASGKNKELAALMGKLGIKMRDANGQVRSGIDLLPELADAFQRNENPAVRARMGMAAFGKSYAEILPLLAEGSQGITDNLARFDRIKGVLGPDEIKGAKDLGDSFKDLQLVMKGFQGTVAKELVPVIKPLVDDLVQWWVVNKKLVGVEVSKMAKDLGEWIKTIDFKEVLNGINGFISSLKSCIEFVGGTRNALLAVVFIMNIQTISAIVGLIGSLGRLGLAFAGVGTKAVMASATMATSMITAGGVASTVAGLAGSAVLVAAAGAVGYAIGTYIADGINLAVQKLSGDKNSTLGTWLYNSTHSDAGVKDTVTLEQINEARAKRGDAPLKSLVPSENNNPSLVGGQKQSASVRVTFDNAPPGMRVEQAQATGNMDVNADVGYRSYAMGMP